MNFYHKLIYRIFIGYILHINETFRIKRRAERMLKEKVLPDFPLNFT